MLAHIRGGSTCFRLAADLGGRSVFSTKILVPSGKLAYVKSRWLNLLSEFSSGTKGGSRGGDDPPFSFIGINPLPDIEDDERIDSQAATTGCSLLLLPSA